MRLTVDEAIALQDDLIDVYSKDRVQKRMYDFAELLKQGKEAQALEEKASFLAELQKDVVGKHGFEASEKGIQEAMVAFSPDDINKDPLVYKRNNRMELLLSGGQGFDSYFSSWQMIQLRNLGVYREIPENRFPVVMLEEPKRMSFGRIGKQPRAGILGPEETDELIAACKKGDLAKASSLLGARKVGASAKAILVNIGYRMIGKAGMETLAKALGKDLESVELDLSGNNLGPEGAKALASKLPPNAKVLKLNVSNNNIGLEGVKALVAGLPKDVEVLSLSFAGMKMGEEGAVALAQGMPQKVRELTLDLYGNNCGDEGVVAISKALPKTIEYLNVMLLENNISRRGLNVFDRQVGDPLNPYHLPKLTNDFFKKTAELELYEFKADADGHVVRQLDWRSNC
mmetsp:Transcript_58209/g.170206  ORF Transcript_58209/g.170206 Transcript_58209/m.170206 type:complete len:401 (+) Transcript_58209:200-1402(+)